MTNDEFVDLFNCVYRFKNKKGEIIYIGKAEYLPSRMSSHTHLPKECYEEIDKIEYTCFPTKDIMDWAERYYIPKIKPEYNDRMKKRNFNNFSISELDKREWKTYNKKIEEVDKRIVEILSGRVFKNNTEAWKNTKANISSISATCNGTARRTYDVNGNILCFMKYVDYTNINKEELEHKKFLALNVGVNPNFNKPPRKVKCLNTGEIFDSKEDAIEFYKIGKKAMQDHLAKRRDEVIVQLSQRLDDLSFYKFEYIS